jgi:light-regulated signal transduction histidine kinase (bacteriophytochrome)
LRHIHGFADILRRDVESILSTDGQHSLERIVEGITHMEKLLEDLLNFSLLGRRDVSRQPTDLKQMVREVIDDLASETANRQIEWRLGDLPTADYDPALMNVVFVNLLSNAVKYTRRCDRAVIEVGSATVEGEAVIFVRDNGVGFDMKYADRLFGVFQRLHREKDFEGTGVGLATVQRILRRHGGKIWAEAEVDKGATFYFTLGGADSIKEYLAVAETTV